jgi:hypothetical protein
MKNIVLSSLVICLIIIITSCTSTQFSSTERSYKNGHVVYKNKHQKEVRLDHSQKVKSQRQKEDVNPNTTFSQIDLTISAMPMDNELVLASTSGNLSIMNNKPITINNRLLLSDVGNQSDKSQKIILSNSVGNQVSNSPDTTVQKQDTNNYARGTVYQPNQPPRKIEGLGVAGSITGVVGLFIAGIPLGILSAIFGMVCVMKVKNNPKRFMGKGFGIAAIILGIVDIIGALIVLSM